MAITYHASAANPADSGTNATTPAAVTPPASCVAGDLALLIGMTRDSAGVSMAISQASGQSWTADPTVASGTNTSAQLFWCRFSGTWGSNPSIDITGGTSPYTAVMHVFRPTAGSNVWSVDHAAVEQDHASGATITATGQATTADSTVQLMAVIRSTQTTYSGIAGSGWTGTGTAQYRNTSGSSQVIAFAHKIRTAAGAGVNVSIDQGTSAAVTTFMIAFAEAEPPATSFDPMGMSGFFGI